MTAARIWHTAKPSQHCGPIQPMDPEQRRFWRLRRERKAAEERKQ